MNPGTNKHPAPVGWPGLKIFEADGDQYTAGDIVDAARFRGELTARWNEFLGHEACEAHARAGKSEPDPGVLESLCEEFRYARDLVTAEETEKWMTDRAVSESQFQRFFERGFWLAKLGETITPTERLLDDATPEDLDQLRIQLMMSGEFDLLAKRLGQRVAARLTTDIPEPVFVDLQQAEHARFLERAGITGQDVPRWLAHLNRDAGWLQLQIESEAVYRFLCGETLTHENMERSLKSLSMALIQFEYDLLEADTEDVLKEAHLSITLDKMSVEELARENGLPFRRLHSFMEFLPEPLQQRFLSGAVGDVVLSGGERPQLFHIVSKTEPSLDNPAVKKHLHRRLLGTLLSGLENKHIHWLLRPDFHQ